MGMGKRTFFEKPRKHCHLGLHDRESGPGTLPLTSVGGWRVTTVGDRKSV